MCAFRVPCVLSVGNNSALYEIRSALDDKASRSEINKGGSACEEVPFNEVGGSQCRWERGSKGQGTTGGSYLVVSPLRDSTRGLGRNCPPFPRDSPFRGAFLAYMRRAQFEGDNRLGSHTYRGRTK